MLASKTWCSLRGLGGPPTGLHSSDTDRFSRELSDGTTLRGHLYQQSFFAAVFGTLFAAFGDILPLYYGVPVCRA